ncbi:XRE family transcriptional regulator [Filifactor alocis]|uniref:LexA family protein n=1 Tax=Filifactor alocis TaxID=143361 RepID=UPI0028E70E7E|nr:XRE family transcriptional regulator [Filifactor alocis]
MTVGTVLRTLRENNKMTLEEVSKKLGIAKQTLYKYEIGIITNIPLLKIEELAKIYNVSPSYITGWEDEKKDNLSQYDNIMPITTKKVPLLGQIACGKPIYANEDRESYIEAGTELKADFCLKATGDSMINARIFDGDIVFIRKQPTVENGEIAAVIIDDSATLKRVFYHPETDILELKAENPKYPVQTYTNEQLNQIKILGKAIAFQGDVI